MEEVISSIEAIETEAEKILEAARGRAREILLEANEEVNKILSSRLPGAEVETECEQIINQARKEADRKIEESKRKASEIKTDVEKKAEKMIGRIVSRITGAGLK